MTSFRIETVAQGAMIVDGDDHLHWTAKDHVFVKNVGGRWTAVRRGPRQSGVCQSYGEPITVTHIVNDPRAAEKIAAAAGLIV